jgi:SAM-dependent methyltransferase
MRDIEKRLQHKRDLLSYTLKYVKPHRIAELGCGSGFVLGFLADRFPQCMIVGTDNRFDRLEQVATTKRPNVLTVMSDVTERSFPEETFHTVLLIAALHEVFSYRGEKAMLDTIANGRDMLAEEGVMIIQDFIRPAQQPVEISFKNRQTEARFRRFVDEFRPRRIRFGESKGGVTVDMADAIEFMGRYRCPSEQEWCEGMAETHFFYTADQYRRAALRIGLDAKDLRVLQTSGSIPHGVEEDMAFDFEIPRLWMQLVLVR